MLADHHVHTEYSDDSTCPFTRCVATPSSATWTKRRLATLGYEGFCTFEHGEPHFHRLEE